MRAEPRECAEPPPSPWIVEALARQNGVCSWSCEDSRQLLRLVAQHGHDWARVAEGLPRHDATSAAAQFAELAMHPLVTEMHRQLADAHTSVDVQVADVCVNSRAHDEVRVNLSELEAYAQEGMVASNGHAVAIPM